MRRWAQPFRQPSQRPSSAYGDCSTAKPAVKGTAQPGEGGRCPVSGNTISGPGKAIQVTGCTHLEIFGNTLETAAGALDDAIILRNVEGLTQEGNTLKPLP